MTGPTCRGTSRAAKASTGSMPARPTAPRRSAPPITDGAAAKPWVFRYKDLRAWWSNAHYDRPGGVESGTPTAWAPQSKPIWFTELGCPAIDRGTNQPNVFFDPKSSESFTPHFSRGWRDDAIQRAYLEATYLWWGEAANNPVSVGLRRPDGARPRMRRLDLGRAAVSVLPGADRRLDGRRELAARALADRAARRGVAGGARPAPLPARRAARGPDRRLRPLGRGRGLRHHGAGKPARLDHHAVAPLRLRRGRDRGRDPLRHARPGLRRHPRARRSGGRPRGRRAGTDARPGDRTAAGAEMAGRPRRRGLRRGPRRGAAHHRGHDADRLGEPSRWRCRPRRPSGAAAAR